MRSTPAAALRPGSVTWAKNCSGPTLLAFGTQAQKDRFLRPIAEVR